MGWGWVVEDLEASVGARGRQPLASLWVEQEEEGEK